MSFDIYKCQRYQKYVDGEGFNRLVFFFLIRELSFCKDTLLNQYYKLKNIQRSEKIMMTYFCFQTDHRIIFTIIQILAKAFCKGNGKMIKNFSLNISGKNAVRNIHVLMYVFFLGS